MWSADSIIDGIVFTFSTSKEFFLDVLKGQINMKLMYLYNLKSPLPLASICV